MNELLDTEIHTKALPQIKDLVQSHGTSFIHGIHPTFSPGQNTLLNRNTTWTDKLNVLLAFSPTLSASTIRKGDSSRSMWSPFGVILADGEITEAYTADGGTQAVSLKQRTPGSNKGNLDQVVRKIGTPFGRYNELVVDNPQISGLYICYDDTSLRAFEAIKNKSLLEAANNHNLPLFLVVNGQLYHHKDNLTLSTLDDTQKIISQRENTGKALPALGWEPITPEEAAKTPYILDEQTLHRLQQGVLQKHIFSLDKLAATIPEIPEVLAYSGGRDMLYQLAAVDTRIKLQGEAKPFPEIKTPFKRNPEFHPDTGQSVLELSSFPKGDSQHTYWLWQKHLLKETVDPLQHLHSLVPLDPHNHSSYIYLVGLGGVDLEKPIHSFRDYFEGIDKQIQYWQEKNKLLVVTCLCLHFYGFAREAEQHGLETLSRPILEYLREKVPLTQMEVLIKKRTSDNMGFILQPEDLIKPT